MQLFDHPSVAQYHTKLKANLTHQLCHNSEENRNSQIFGIEFPSKFLKSLSDEITELRKL